MMSKSIFGHLFLPVNADIGEQPVLTVLIFQIYWKILQIISCETMIKLERPSFNILNYTNNNYNNLQKLKQKYAHNFNSSVWAKKPSRNNSNNNLNTYLLGICRLIFIVMHRPNQSDVLFNLYLVGIIFCYIWNLE